MPRRIQPRGRTVPDTSLSIPAYLAHVTHGRARLRTTGKLPQEELRILLDAMAGLPGVTRTVARPNTMSVIVEANLSRDQLRSTLEDADFLRLRPKPPAPPLGAALQLGVLQTDAQVRKRTFGQLNLHTALGAILLVAAIVQLGRGRVFGPTATLLVNALALLESGSRTR
jgi:hypothetical protein